MAPNDRQERRLARQRGAGYRELKNANFGFTFGQQPPDVGKTPQQPAGKRPAKSTSKRTSRKSVAGPSNTQASTDNGHKGASNAAAPSTGKLRRASATSTAITPSLTGKRKRGSMAPPLLPVSKTANDHDELEATAEELQASARKGTGSAESRKSRRPSVANMQVAGGEDELEANDVQHQVSTVPRPFRSTNSTVKTAGNSAIQQRLSILQPPVHFAPPTGSVRRRAPLAQMETPVVNALGLAPGVGGSARTAVMMVTPGMDKGKALSQMREQSGQSMNSFLGADGTPRTPVPAALSFPAGQTPNGVPTRLIDPQLLALAANRAQSSLEDTENSMISLLPENDMTQTADNTEFATEDSVMASHKGASSNQPSRLKNKGKGRALDVEAEPSNDNRKKKGKRKSGDTMTTRPADARPTKRRKSEKVLPSSQATRIQQGESSRNAREQSRGRSRIPRSPVYRPPLATKSQNPTQPRTAPPAAKPRKERQSAKARLEADPDVKLTIPITIYRLTAPRPSDFIARADDAQDSDDDDPLNAAAPQPSRLPGVNPVDVLNQVITELIAHHAENLIKQHRKIPANAKAMRVQVKRNAAAVRAFEKHCSDAFFSLSTTLDANTELEGRVRLANKEKAALRAELMALRRQREELALQMDQVRARNLARREEFQQHQSVNAALYDIELAVKRGREKSQGAGLSVEEGEIGVEALAREVGNMVSGEGAILQKIKGINEALEVRARTLEGRA